MLSPLRLHTSHAGAGAGDDTINIQSNFLAIVAADPAGRSVTIGGHPFIDLFAAGDNVTVYLVDGVSLGSALIVGVAEVPPLLPPGTTNPLFNNETMDGATYLKVPTHTSLLAPTSCALLSARMRCAT